MDHDHEHGGHGTTASPGHGGGGGGHHDMGSHMMMAMSFHTGLKETVLFDAWKVEDEQSMAYSCIIIFAIAVFYEGLKYLRETLYTRRKEDSVKKLKIAHVNGSREALQVRPLEKKCLRSMFTPFHGLQTFLHALQFFTSYLLMLIFMTYNVWLCLAVIAGATFGFFVFGWTKTDAVDITEHCQ